MLPIDWRWPDERPLFNALKVTERSDMMTFTRTNDTARQLGIRVNIQRINLRRRRDGHWRFPSRNRFPFIRVDQHPIFEQDQPIVPCHIEDFWRP